MDASMLDTFYSPGQLERWRGVIPARYSCRAYAGGPAADQLAALSYAAQRVSLPGTRIVIADCPEDLFVHVPFVEHIHGMDKCAVILADREQYLPHTLAGISGEAFVLEAAAMGVGTCWVTGTYRRSAVPVEKEEGELVAAVTPLGLPAVRDAQPPRKRKKLAQICLTPPESWPLWAYQAAEAVRQAPSAVNLQPWSLSYAQRTLRLLAKRPDSVDAGIAVLHMAAAVGGCRPHWAWGEDKCVAHLLVEEDK